jgi:hypothetical protein
LQKQEEEFFSLKAKQNFEAIYQNLSEIFSFLWLFKQSIGAFILKNEDSWVVWLNIHIGNLSNISKILMSNLEFNNENKVPYFTKKQKINDILSKISI